MVYKGSFVDRKRSPAATAVMPNINYLISRRKLWLPLALAAVLLAALIWMLFFRNSGTGSAQTVKSNQEATIDTQDLNKTYTLPALNPSNTAQKKGLMEMTVLNARKLNQVQVEGKPVDAPAGKAFISLDIELQNKADVSLGFFSRDYIRLIEGDKPYAPQFYNRGIAVAPVSIKSDRVAFLVDKSQKNFQIRIGELQGQSELVEVNFSK